jgi:hypothetical protein
MEDLDADYLVKWRKHNKDNGEPVQRVWLEDTDTTVESVSDDEPHTAT